MTIETAIQKAIKYGWDSPEKEMLTWEVEDSNKKYPWDHSVTLRSVLYEPQFWSSLGAAICKSPCCRPAILEPHMILRGRSKCTHMHWCELLWVPMIRHLAEGKTIEAYFAKL